MKGRDSVIAKRGDAQAPPVDESSSSDEEPEKPELTPVKKVDMQSKVAGSHGHTG